MSDGPPLSRRRGGLWHRPDFRRLWIGETVSQLGTTVTQLVLPLVAILTVHATTLQVGVLAMFETIAFLIVGLPAGAWVDRLRLRSVLIVNDLVRAAAIASVPIACYIGRLTMAQLYAVALLSGICTVFFDVSYQSYLPELVDRGELVEGNAKLQASASVSQIAGPSAGGVLMQVIGGPYTLGLDALSFLWSAAWVFGIQARPAKLQPAPDRHLVREIGEGLHFVLRNRLLRSIAMCTASANLFSSMAAAVVYVLLARQLHLSPGWIGLLGSTSAVGGLVGSLVARRFAARVGQGPAIWLSTLVIGPCAFVAPFVHRDWTLVLLAVAQAALWMGSVVYNIAQVSFRQGLCPPELLGRMNATMRFLVWGTLPLGGLLGGVLGSTIGVRQTLFVAALGGSLVFVPVFFSPLRGMRELPVYRPPEELGESPVADPAADSVLCDESTSCDR